MVVASPAAPYRTVHAVLPHTALRHRSPSGIRTPAAHRARQPVDPERREPPVGETGGPVPARDAVLDARQLGQSFVDVAVDDAELPGRVAVAVVRRSTPQHGVEFFDNDSQLTTGMAPWGSIPDLGPDGGHGPVRGPLLQVVAALLLRELPHMEMEAQEVEPVLALTEASNPGLVGMQAQPDRCQGRRRQIPSRFGSFFGGTQDAEVVAVTHQSSRARSRRLPRPIEDVKGDDGEQRRDGGQFNRTKVVGKM